MAIVKLKDVVYRVKDKVDKDNTNLEYYVGGEHIDSGEISITKKGKLEGSTIGPAFHMHFMPGDVLLMSRNPHLRKAGVVDFEGICSDVSYVCRTKDEKVLLQQYLPFIFQTEHFWEFVEENKKGGLPFFLNWSDFEKYEFYLPEIEKQKELTNILWAAQKTKLSYRNLLKQTDELVKSQFIEEFGDPASNSKGLSAEPLSKHLSVTGGFAFKSKEFRADGIPVLRIGNINSGRLLKTNMVYWPYDESLSRYFCRPGDLVISLTGTVGKGDYANICRLGNDFELYYLNQRNAKLTLKDSVLPEYITALLSNEEVKALLTGAGQGVRQANISNADILNLVVPIPPIEEQQAFAQIVEQSDKSKFEIKQAISNIDVLIKSLMANSIQ